jgi:hypothetical protein
MAKGALQHAKQLLFHRGGLRDKPFRAGQVSAVKRRMHADTQKFLAHGAKSSMPVTACQPRQKTRLTSRPGTPNVDNRAGFGLFRVVTRGGDTITFDAFAKTWIRIRGSDDQSPPAAGGGRLLHTCPFSATSAGWS